MRDKIARWYEHGLWTAKMVHDAMDKGIITEQEYRDIVRE